MPSVLKGKRVLVVDDEPDVCEMVRDELMDCEVEVAGSFEQARRKLERGGYDVVILDIMGVSGYELLEGYAEKFPCIMLTANALGVEHLRRSMAGKARLYLPKEELGRLEEYVAKVLAEPRPLWRWLLAKLDFRRWLGEDLARLEPELFRDLDLSPARLERDLRSDAG
ncbi:MAG: hypothetical protein KatS3mg102_0897 [Planctomycetota bacterium]|nr:MAG: hypothetical protein KatS3mg102_0897 [Planctomycetota bacterium]